MDDTIPQITEGVQVLSRAITPKSTTSTLHISVQVPCSANGAYNVQAAVFRDSTAGAVASRSWTGATNTVTSLVFFTDVPSASLTATTFTVRVGPAVGTVTINGIAGARFLGGTLQAIITITEVEA